MRGLLTVVLMGIAVASCGEDRAPDYNADTSGAGGSAAAVRKLDAAVAQARGTLPDFRRIASAPAPGQTDFAVRAGFPHENGVEHLWLREPRFSGDTVTGVAESDALYLPIRKGHVLAVLTSSISDWIYLDNGKVQGGYTDRVLVEQRRGK